MPAAITDKFTEATNGTRPVPTTLTAIKAVGAASISCGALTGWPTATAVHFIIYTTDVSGNKVAGSQTDWKGIVSGTSITNLTLKAGTDNGYSVGAIVEAAPTAAWADDLTEGILVEHEQDGTHGTELITSRTEDTDPDPDADFVLTYDTSAAQLKKVKPSNLAGVGDGWIKNVLPAPNTITANGNRSYTLVFNSIDLTSTISEGQRLRLTRTVSAQTQCTDLESSSSQYWNDTSVSGMTFTDDFVAGAWVKLESYTTAPIISRYNGTSGWKLFVLSDGRVFLDGYNAGSSNFSRVNTYQSIPLGKWVHIAAQLDMSAFTATSTTSYIMIDGVDVPVQVTRSGTNPTALVQAGDLQVGKDETTNYLDGKLAQVFVSSAKITQANVRTLISQGLTASLISTHSIVSAYSFDNSANDLNTTNANNLTAQGSAVSTNVDSPFGNYLGGTFEYGIIATKPTFSTNTTVVVQVPEGCAIPTSGGISATSYSMSKTPYGFPSDKGQWRVSNGYNTRASQSSAVSGTTYNLGERISIPAGKWMVGYKGVVYSTGTSGVQSTSADLQSSSATFAAGSLFSNTGMYTDAVTSGGGTVSAEAQLNLAAQTEYYLNIKAGHTGTNTQIAWLHDFARTVIYADIAHL